MHIPVRSCLIAGMLALPVGTIMATPMASLRTRPDTAHSPVHIQQIQLAVSAPPVTTRHVAHTAMPVHALAEVTRKFESAKSAAATPSGPAKHAPSPVARIAAGRSATAAMTPSQASRPDSDNARPSARSTAVATVELPGIADVVAHAAQLAIDIMIAEPAMIVGATAFNIDELLIDAASLNPDTIDTALENFIDSETAVVKITLDDVDGDLQSLRESVGALLGVGSDLRENAVAAVKKAASDTPASTSTSNSVGLPRSKHRSDPGHRGRWKPRSVAGEPAPVVPTKSADDGNTAGQDDDTAATAPTGTQRGSSSHPNTPATKASGTNNATVAQVNRPTVTKPGSTSSTKTTFRKSHPDHVGTRAGRANPPKSGSPGTGTENRHKHTS
ncbi:hypothetical protein [Mycobacterium sp. URHB0021]